MPILKQTGVRSDGHSSPLRVAYYFAYPDTLAGAARSIFELITNLPPEVEPVVIVAAEGRVAAACRDLRIDCHVVEAGPALMTFGKKALHWSVLKRIDVLGREFMPYTLRLAFTLRRLEIDIVHANDSRGGLLIGAAALLARLPMVTHLRGRKAYSGAYWQAFEMLSTSIIAVCNALHEDVSPSARSKVLTVYDGAADLQSGKIHALSTPTSLRWLDKQRADGHVVVTCFASVTPFKGYHHLIDAIAKLKARGANKVIFLGIGAVSESYAAYQDWLFDKMRELGVDNFTLAGWQDDPSAFYARTDIAVLPSVEQETLRMGDVTVPVEGNEGFPRAHLEAMSVGLPVVGTRIGGIPEQVIDGVTGFVVLPGSPEELADALERLISDAALRKRMGEAGRARALTQFSTQQFVDGTLAVYRSLDRRKRLPSTQLA